MAISLHLLPSDVIRFGSDRETWVTPAAVEDMMLDRGRVRKLQGAAPRDVPYHPPIDYLDLADHLWPVLGPLMRGHAALYRATGGLLGGKLPGLPPLLLLDHRGARSGTLRTTPLVYMPDGEKLLVVASKGGHPQNPAWFHNLRAHPDTEIQIGRRRLKVRAREASPEERRRLWPRAADYNPHWDRYRRRTAREIPLVLLEPRPA